MARPWISSKPLRGRISEFLIERGGLLAVVVACVYIWLAPAHILDGDNAEFSTLAVTGGTAHPSGYPLYLLWLRALSWLPGSSPAHVAALANVVLAVGLVLVLHAACRAWGARALGATIAVAVFAAAPVVVRVSTEAEVFVLNALVVATVLWLATRGGPLTGKRRTVALAIVAGLGIANHMTCVLIAPVGLLGALRGVRESRQPAVTIALGVGGLVLGLLPYAYLFATPDTPLSWGKVASVGDVISMITREDYGGAGAFLPTGESVSAWTQLAIFGRMLGRTWLGLGAVAGIAMLVWRIVRPDAESRWSWPLLAASFVMAGPVLVTRFNLEPTGLGLYVCQRFYFLPAMMLAIPIAVACNGVRVRERLLCVLVATIGFLVTTATSLPYLARVHTPAVENYARNLLTVLPQNAVVFVGQDDEYLGLGYLQWAVGMRQDVTVVAPQLVTLRWYRERIARRDIVAPPGEGPDIVRVIDRLLAVGRPVFVEKARAEIIGARPTYPFATLMRVLPANSLTPSIEQVFADNEALFARFDLRYPRPGPDDELATAVHGRYGAAWSTIGRKAQSLGRADLAERAYAYANAYAPRR